MTRALEKDQLRLALINRDVEPAMMTKHLATLCAVRECPVLCLPGLADTLGPLLNLKSVVAIGFKVMMITRCRVLGRISKLPIQNSNFKISAPPDLAFQLLHILIQI